MKSSNKSTSIDLDLAPTPTLALASQVVSEPDWKAVARLVMQQRDQVQLMANNLAIDLALAHETIAALKGGLATGPVDL
jgi:hypothetical protein